MKQSIKFLLVIFSLTIFFASCKKDKTADLDITKHEWDLKSIKQNGTIYKLPSGNFKNPNAYILKFENDSIFWLNLSINDANGQYNIQLKGNVEIKSYSNATEAGMTDFDDKLIHVFKQMISYKVKGKTLTFKGNNNEVEFRQQ